MNCYDIEMVKEGYAKFAKGDVVGAVANWSPDIEWYSCTGFPFVKSGGKYMGVQDVINGVLSQIPVYYDNFYIEIADFVESGDKIVMVGFYTGVWKQTGKKFKANAAHIWYMKEGKAVRFIQAVDTAEIVN